MKMLISFLVLAIAITGCKKCPHHDPDTVCDIQKTYTDNASKVTISNGVWGTVSSMEGDCMPMTSPTTCKHCPAKRRVLIYQYTLLSQATPSDNSSVFFNSFSTQLIAQVEADDDGFFQATLSPGNYSIAILEDGKLYANGTDGQGGINPVSISGGLLKANQTMTYKAVF